MHPLTLYRRFLAAALKIFFRLLYHQFAWTYDWVAAIVSVGMWQRWVLAVLPDLQGPRVLEVGQGPGHLQAALMQKGIYTYGLDASPNMGRLALRRLTRRGFKPSLILARAQRIPFPDETFQTVVSTFPSEYIGDPLALQEAQRVLTPGGRLVVLLGAWITGRRPAERAAAWLFRVTGESLKLPSSQEAVTWENRLLEPVRRVGLIARAEFRETPSSTLLVILAERV